MQTPLIHLNQQNNFIIMPRTNPIFDRDELENIIRRCEVCYLGMADTNATPYVLPFNFAFDDNAVYLHSAQEGTKMTILHANPRVCVAFSTDHQLRHSHDEVACSYGMKYRSVLVHGRVEFIDDFDEKQRVLNLIMKKYVGREFTFGKPSVNEVCVYKVPVERITGRQSGY